MLRNAKIIYSDGTEITTSLAGHLTDKEIRDYFKIGKQINIGNGPADNLQTVIKCEPEPLINNNMKNLLEILKNDPADFTLSEFNMPRYNAMDHPDHMTGRTATEKAQCIYSVYKVDIKNDLAYTQNINAWGRYITETHPLSHLIKHS